LENIDYIINSIGILKPELAVAVSLVAIVLLDLLFNNKKIIAYAAIFGLLVTLFFIYIQYDVNEMASAPTGEIGLLSVDSFGSFFKLLIAVSSIIIIFLSIISNEIKKVFERHGEYYALMMGMILGMFLMVSATDLILIYLSIELVSLCSYVLAGFTKSSLRNSEASLKYIIYGSAASGILLFGVSILYGLTGSTNLFEINSIISSTEVPFLPLLFSFIMVFTGIGFKISAVPFHFWTPDVYEGSPLPFTAYLSIASKAAGFGLLIRFIKVTFITNIDSDGNWQLLNIIDWRLFFVFISIITMTIGNFAALWQDNLKRMLAYSSIAHAGYMLLGLAVLSNQGIFAIMIYLMIYLFMNLGAFLIVMLIANKTGSENIDDYNGLGFSMPLAGVALTIFLISLTGLPPTAGFIGKLYLFMALVNADMILVAIIALLNTVVSLYYYVRILKHLYLKGKNESDTIVNPSFGTVLFIIIILAPVLLFGIYFAPLVELTKNSLSIIGF
jgi:NADH-quinone oxidoreductase subunit N